MENKFRTAYSLTKPDYNRLKEKLDFLASIHTKRPDLADPVFQVCRDHSTQPPKYEAWHFHSATLELKRDSEESLVLYVENGTEKRRHESLLINISNIPIKLTPIEH